MASPLIVVTGATGTIGSQVVKQLVAEGHRVRALVRNPVTAAKLGAKVEIVVDDLSKPASLDPAFAGVEEADGLMRYFDHGVKAGKIYPPTLTISACLGRPPHSFNEWLMGNIECLHG